MGFMAAHYPVVPLLIVISVSLIFPSAAQQSTAGPPLSVEEIVRLTKAGVSEEVIVGKIKKNAKSFDLSEAELIELKTLGVTDTVVKTLMDPSLPYAPVRPAAPPPPPKPAPPSRKFPEDPHAGAVPPELGMYRISRNVPVPMEMKLFLGQKQGPGLGKVLLKKGKTVGYLAGPVARTRYTEASPVFYFRLAEGKGIEELLLVSLDPKKDRRELDMGPPAPKPELNSETIRQFDSLEVGAGLFRLTPVNLGKGEYAWFLISTAEPPKGNYGKGYEFGVDPPAVPKKP